MTKQIIYKEIIQINGREYTVTTCDYSDSVNELIQNQIIENNNQEIINHIVDDIVNSQ
jgi:hypothetical protein